MKDKMMDKKLFAEKMRKAKMAKSGMKSEKEMPKEKAMGRMMSGGEYKPEAAKKEVPWYEKLKKKGKK